MKKKFFTLTILSIFALVVLMSGVSALELSANPSSVTLSNSTPSASVNVSSDINFNLTSSLSETKTIEDKNNHEIDIKLTAQGDTTKVTSILFNLNITKADSNFDIGTYSTKFNITGVNSTNDSTLVTVKFNKKFYEKANEGKLNIREPEFSVEEGFGDDEDFWYPLDLIKVRAEVENNGDGELDDIEIETCLFDKTEGRCILDEEDMNLSENDFSLESGDSIDVDAFFRLNPDDLNAGNKDYTFYVRAIGEIDDSDSQFDGNETGISNSKDIEIRTDEEFIIADDLTHSELVSCKEEFQLSGKLWNVGDEEIDEEDLFLRIIQPDLGIDRAFNFSETLDEFDYLEFTTTFSIPSDAYERTYPIELVVYDDEDLEDNDIYENNEDDQSIFRAYVEVSGNCVYATSETTDISASLESGGKAGENLVVKTTVTNNGDKEATYMLSVSGHSGWGSLINITPSELTLSPGESGDATITLSTNKDTSGEKTFDIESYSGGQPIKKQPVQVTLESSGFSLSGITGGAISEGNWYLWGIGLVNVLLVAAIIFVVIRMARSSKEA